MDRGPGRPRGRRGVAGHQKQGDDPRPPGPAGGLYPGADVCPRQRLCKEWKADIGTPVKSGDLLAEIDAPDLDQQIMQARSEPRQRQSQFGALRCDAQARPDRSSRPTRYRSRTSTSARPTPPTNRGWFTPRRRTSTGCACSNNTSASSHRSTASSPRAPPTSAR